MNNKKNVKLVFLVLICFMLTAVCAFGKSPGKIDKKSELFAYGKPTFGFALAIKPQVKFFDFGYIVLAIVRIKNISNKELKLTLMRSRLQYFFEVTDLSGEKIPKLLFQKDMDRQMLKGISPFGIYAKKIKPGEFLEYRFNLSQRFDFTMAASYIVQGRRTIIKNDPIKKKKSYSNVFSPKLKFTIK